MFEAGNLSGHPAISITSGKAGWQVHIVMFWSYPGMEGWDVWEMVTRPSGQNASMAQPSAFGGDDKIRTCGRVCL
jgi:hypothetical protein